MAESVGRLLDLENSSGKLELGPDGFYVRFVPSEEEKQRIERYLASEIEQAIADHAPIFKEMAENLKAYRATEVNQKGNEDGPIKPLPLVAISVDQIVARTYNSLVQPRPMVSIEEYFNDTYNVIVPLDLPVDGMMGDMGVQPGMPGMGGPEMGMGAPNMGMPPEMMGGAPPQMMTVPQPTPVDSTELARRLQQGFEFKARERINLPKLFKKAAFNTTVLNKVYIKVVEDRQARIALAPSRDEFGLPDWADPVEIRLSSPEAARMYVLSPFNVLKPVDEDDVETSPWVAEKLTPISPDDFLGRVESEEYNLVAEEDAKNMANAVSDVLTEYERDVRAAADKKSPQDPKKAVNLMEVQLDWYVKVKSNVEGKKATKKKLSFFVIWHHAAKKICAMWRNPYEHQQRTIVEGVQTEDGSCTASRSKWHQTVATYAIQSEIKNAFHANNFAYWVRPGSEAEDYFAGNKPLRSGEAVVGVFNEDWGVVRPGADHSTMMPLAQWAEGAGQRATDENSYKQGQSVPGRTAASTVSQILEQGMQQPLMFLRMLDEAFSKAIRLYLKTSRQFKPFGETLPIKDPKTKAITDIPFRYPIAEDGIDPLDNFRIALTAADEALAKERDPAQVQMMLGAYQQHANFLAQVAGPMANPQASPATTELFQKIIEGEQAIFTNFMAIFRADEDKFDVTKEIQSLVEEKAAALQAQQQAAQMGAMNAGNPNAGPEAVPPGPGGAGNGGPMPGMAPPPGNGGGPPAPAPAGVPAG